jgi:hypothetical protein
LSRSGRDRMVANSYLTLASVVSRKVRLLDSASTIRLSVCPSVSLPRNGSQFLSFFARQWTVVTQTQKLSKSWREGSTDRLRHCHSYEEKMLKTNLKKEKRKQS